MNWKEPPPVLIETVLSVLILLAIVPALLGWKTPLVRLVAWLDP